VPVITRGEAADHGDATRQFGQLRRFQAFRGRGAQLCGEMIEDVAQLAKFLIVQQFFAEQDVIAALEKVQQKNKNLPGHTMANSLLMELCEADTDKLDQIISSLVDRTKAAFIPLEYYDFDRQLARMLPDNLTIGRLCVPFDLISRTIMVACCNPFDAAGRAAVQQSLDYTVSWYLARPAAIERTLQDVYRLELKA